MFGRKAGEELSAKSVGAVVAFAYTAEKEVDAKSAGAEVFALTVRSEGGAKSVGVAAFARTAREEPYAKSALAAAFARTADRNTGVKSAEAAVFASMEKNGASAKTAGAAVFAHTAEKGASAKTAEPAVFDRTIAPRPHYIASCNCVPPLSNNAAANHCECCNSYLLSSSCPPSFSMSLYKFMKMNPQQRTIGPKSI